jgi:photosystem II stability/assembly factor-like uncharacterized protein
MDILNIISLLVGILSLLVTLLIEQDRIAEKFPEVLRKPRTKIALRMIASLALVFAVFGLLILPRTKVVEWLPAAPAEGASRQANAGQAIQLRQSPDALAFTKTSLLSSDVFPTTITARSGPDGRTFFAGTYGGGIYVSQSPGEWQLFGLEEQTITKLITYDDPAEGVFAATNLGIFVTYDNGQNWESRWFANDLVTDLTSHPDDHQNLVASNLNGIFYSSDGGRSWIAANVQNQVITSIVRAQRNPARLYASGLFGSVYKSGDGGLSWELIREPDGEGSAPLAVSPMDENTVFMGPGSLGIYRTTDGGASWEHLGLKGVSISSIVISPTTGIVYVGSDDGRGLLTSDNHGRTWTNRGILSDDVFFIWEDTANPSNMMVATRSNGILSSSDLGATWINIGLGGLSFERDFTVQRLLIVDGEPDHLLAIPSDEKGVYESRDGGVTWTALPGNTDLLNVFPYDLYQDPFNPEHLFVSGLGGEIFESLDRGSSWRSITHNLPRVGFAPLVTFRDGTLYSGPGNHGVWKKDSGGQSWAPVGLAGVSIEQLWADQANGRLYALDGIGLLHYSFDGGETWSDTGNEFLSVAIDPTNLDHIVAVDKEYEIAVSRDGGSNWDTTATLSAEAQYTQPSLVASGSGSGYFYLSNDMYFFSSKDGGQTWQQSRLPQYGRLAASSGNVLYFIGSQTLQRSENYGLTWTAVNYKYASLSSDKLIQIGGDRYLAGSEEDGLFISDDAGESWTQTSIGADYKVLALTRSPGSELNIFALLESPFSELIYAYSSEGGPWTLLATGCNSRRSENYFEEISGETGILWQAECLDPQALFIIDPLDLNQTLVVDLTGMTSLTDALYAPNGKVTALSSPLDPVVWETLNKGKTWVKVGALDRFANWSLSNDQRSTGILHMHQMDGTLIGTYSAKPVVPYSSYIALCFVVLVCLLVSVQSHLIFLSWSDMKDAIALVLFSPHVPTADLNRFTAIVILPLLALLNVILMQIFPKSEYAWTILASQNYTNIILTIAQLLRRIPVTLFTSVGYIYISATLVFVVLILIMIWLMNMAATLARVRNLEATSQPDWTQAFVKGTAILIFGNYGMSFLGLLLAYLPRNDESVFGISYENIFNLFALLIFYKITAVCINTVADSSRVGYRAVALLYMFFTVLVSVGLTFGIVFLVLLLDPSEQVLSRLEALPTVQFGLANILLTFIYLILNQDRRDRDARTVTPVRASRRSSHA